MHQTPSKLRLTRAGEPSPKPTTIIRESLKKPKNSRNMDSAEMKTTCTPKLYPETLPDIPYYSNNAQFLHNELEKLKLKLDTIRRKIPNETPEKKRIDLME